ncbi:MAG TPA: HIT family protein [Candidatus Saccharimonadales bacterium]|nr:HIT family protein [Candidatus Saccharimonadales bacterium]
MAEPTLFDKIIARQIPALFVWEDSNYAAFLTPFANTPGVTVVVPKHNPGDYVFNLSDDQIAGLMSAAKKVAHKLQRGLGADRVAAVFEGEAVPHVHVKLYPMHNMHEDRESPQKAFFSSYPGYITTQEGPKMDDAELVAIQKKIVEATDEN